MPLYLTGDFLVTCNLKLATFSAAADTNCTAAVTREQSAAGVPFQRRAPLHLPPQNVSLADTREHPASHFGGKYAKNAKAVNFSHFANKIKP